jgi:hypothetical protein
MNEISVTRESRTSNQHHHLENQCSVKIVLSEFWGTLQQVPGDQKTVVAETVGATFRPAKSETEAHKEGALASDVSNSRRIRRRRSGSPSPMPSLDMPRRCGGRRRRGEGRATTPHTAAGSAPSRGEWLRPPPASARSRGRRWSRGCWCKGLRVGLCASGGMTPAAANGREHEPIQSRVFNEKLQGVVCKYSDRDP